MRYGDKAPKSIVARIFSIFWILLGLVIMAIFVANITSALTALSMQLEPTDLVDVKVCPNICFFICYNQFKQDQTQEAAEAEPTFFSQHQRQCRN